MNSDIEDITKNYRYSVQVYFVNRQKPLQIELRRNDADRFKNNIDSFNDHGNLYCFFCSDTVDGKSIALNISLVQAIHFLWEPTVYPEETKRHEGPIRIFLKNRKNPLKAYTDNPEQLSDFYFYLENGPSLTGKFQGFIDHNGEEILINTDELLYIEAPIQILIEGYEIIMKDYETEKEVKETEKDADEKGGTENLM